MRDLLEQIQAAIDARAYYLSLYVSLIMPDICAAMESTDGRASPKKYVAWFDRHVASSAQIRMTGETCWYYRCAVLHQGRAQHPRLGFSRVLFVEPVTNVILHNNVVNDALNIDVSIFCREMIRGAESWLRVAEDTDNYKRNYPLSMQRYPDGLPPYMTGVPVIG